MKDNNEKKVRRGEPLKIPAATWNNIIDSAKHHKRNRYNPVNAANGGTLTSLIKSNIEILVKNASGSDISESFHIMRLSLPVLDITEDRHAANRRIGFNGMIPTDIDNAIVILQTPLEVTDISNGVISGLSIVTVMVLDPSHEWANPTPGETKYLTSSECGQARILAYTESIEPGEEGLSTALVNLIGSTCSNQLISGSSGTSGASGGSTGGSNGGSGGSEGSTGGSGGSSGGSGGDSNCSDCFNIHGQITNICPVFEDVTYEEAIAELEDLFTQVPGYDDVGNTSLGRNGVGNLIWQDIPSTADAVLTSQVFGP